MKQCCVIQKVAVLLGLLVMSLGVDVVLAQEAAKEAVPIHDNVILPQRRLLGRTNEKVEIEKINVRVAIKGDIAETAMDVFLKNTGNSLTEAQMLMPVPEGITIKAFSYGKNPAQYPARLLPADEARQLYDTIVRRMKDPALLEFAGLGAVRTSVFPIPAGEVMSVRLVYEQVLDLKNGRYDYVLPRSEAFDQKSIWNVRVEIDGAAANVYSPSHEVEVQARKDASPGAVVVLKGGGDKINPGSFRLSWQRPNQESKVSVFACPSQETPDSGYFMLVYTPDARTPYLNGKRQLREVTLVLDRSGSMRGEKLEKVKESAKQIIAALEPNESFNVITYNEGVDQFREKPVAKNAGNEKEAFAWIDGITARGGTNIYDSLSMALSQPVERGYLPITLFLTDGLPTIGNTAEKAIVELAELKNPEKRRVFCVGVGTDVNASLLRRISGKSRAVSTFILPKEDVEVKMSDLFAKLYGPVASDISMSVLPSSGRVRDVLPRPIPDVYEGTRLVIVGQYVGKEPIDVKLAWTGGELFTAKIEPALIASIKDDFVARIWAIRQIAFLQESLRDLGVDSTRIGDLLAQEKTKEIAEEIMRLSTQFGVMSDFTSFFADDGQNGADFSRRNLDSFRSSSPTVYQGKAMGYISPRSGGEAVAREMNIEAAKSKSAVDKFNSRSTKDGAIVKNETVYQIGQSSYSNVDGIFEENTIASHDEADSSARKVVVGTKEYEEAVTQLVKENRQGLLAIDGTVKIKLNGELILLQNSIN